ncbi:hypothetical protein BSK59_20150 [Paenibacillus odorifer]|uniref:glycoside hydrolase family 125 protein n=1 Tax=Paenibacillus TaxID=44249 RepID=UPI00096C368B|nr:glycoside hydrolase family 125 protein [Paenibacillus odorifer]OME51829.1 hypothetical protein BSK59_20150 [Paenibacillus odorifer]
MSISSDNLQAALEATEYLFDLSHTHISFLPPPPVDTTAVEDRIEGLFRPMPSGGHGLTRRADCRGKSSGKALCIILNMILSTSYEIDSLGGVNFMDDTFVPSLLSILYLGHASADDPLYLNTPQAYSKPD